MKKDFIKECMLDKDNIIISVISLVDANPLLIYVSKTAEVRSMIGLWCANDETEGIKL